ncbi:hypothetical protein [Mesorhizobium abyssinicae]|uniref:hypothetical protein n=1 Tax=Mesorhizobium abyssinicae TaxID=1209958 RepID=UPI000FD49784|nr:hypothetical protein EN779_31945 [Mesorhizobium sp. M4B.F.Ca.ET.088.02.2.1]
MKAFSILPNGIMPADKVVIRRRQYNWLHWRLDLVPVPHHAPRLAGVSKAMHKKCKTLVVNKRLRQECGAMPRRIH